MRAFLILVRLRTLDVARSGPTFLLFMSLPLVLLGVVALVFANGHPFERKEVLLHTADDRPETAATTASVGEELARLPELRLERVADASVAHARIRTRMASAMVFVEGDRVRVTTGPRDRLFAKGLASILAPHAHVESTETDVPRWGYVHYLFPGLLTFSVLLAGLFGMGYAMVRYRTNLLLKKLATTPLSRTTFVAAQVAARTALVLVQLVVMVATAKVAFGLPLTPASAAWLAVVAVMGLLVFTGIGFVLACVVKTESLVVDVINAISVPLVFFSEIFFPVSELPSWLATLARALPSTAMVRLTREVILFGASDLRSLGPGLLQLGAWALASYTVSIALFKWHR